MLKKDSFKDSKLFLVGLTGGIGTGKSTVLAGLKTRGFSCIDVDKYAKDALRKGTSCYERVVAVFGRSTLLPNGEVNRAYLRDIILQDAKKRKLLEDIVHPQVLSDLEAQIKAYLEQGIGIVVVEVPLLYEVGWQALFARVICVVSSEETALTRLMRRHNVEEKTAKTWLRTQIPIQEKAKMADFVVPNDGSIEDLEEKVEALAEWIKKEYKDCVAVF